jgi:hypothetical protein
MSDKQHVIPHPQRGSRREVQQQRLPQPPIACLYRAAVFGQALLDCSHVGVFLSLRGAPGRSTTRVG